ncbi:HAD-IA family hydrolase [Ruegeria atlantica]|uniref:HAD-IA family hydrolase n=1 Tax=Ruegeria atlantica TaxID=81569 RepID=UPI0014817A13|nr:HAD-IA family hydrolase [Ruegeria atlantica]
MAKCLMLDVDGVLVDGRPGDGLRWDTDLLKDLGLNPNLLAEEFFKTEWTGIVEGRTELLPVLEAVLKRVAPTIKARDLIDYWFREDSGIVETTVADVRDARSKGISVYLATNQDHMRAIYLMQTMELGNEVDGIVYSAKAGCRKPKPEFFDFAAQEVGRQPGDLLLVDDTLPNVEAARSAGWKAVHWDGTERLSAILHRSLY